MASKKTEKADDDMFEYLRRNVDQMLETREQNLLRRLDLISKTLLEHRDLLREMMEGSRPNTKHSVTNLGDSKSSAASYQGSREERCQQMRQQTERGPELSAPRLLNESPVDSGIRQPKASSVVPVNGFENYHTPCVISPANPPPPQTKVYDSGGLCKSTTTEPRPWRIEVTDLGIPAIIRRKGQHEDAILSNWRMQLHGIIRRPVFDFFWLMIIGLNALFMGVQIQYYVDSGSYHASNSIGEVVFTTLYLMEFFVRIAGDGARALFLGKEWAWSFLDVCVLTMSIVDLTLDFTKGSTASTSSFRILRVFRVLRIAKIIRGVRFLRNLRLLIVGMINSVMAISWTVFALLFIMYLGAVVVLSIVIEDVVEGSSYYMTHWSGIEVAMCTLFQVMTGDSWWSVVGRGVRDDHPSVIVFLMMYFCVTAYGLLNIVTGVFVEQTLSTSKKDAELLRDRNDESKVLMKAFLEDLFEIADVDRDGRISYAEFAKAFNDPQIQFGFALINLEAVDVRNMFCVVDADGDGEIDVKEFVEGLLNLQGFPTNADLVEHNLRIMAMLQQVMTEFKRIKSSTVLS